MEWGNAVLLSISFKRWCLQLYVFWLLCLNFHPGSQGGLRPIPGSTWLGPRLETRYFSSFPPLQTLDSKSAHPGLSWSLSPSRHWSVASRQSLHCKPGHPGISSSPSWPSLPALFPDVIPDSSMNVLLHSPRHQGDITPWVLI